MTYNLKNVLFITQTLTVILSKHLKTLVYVTIDSTKTNGVTTVSAASPDDAMTSAAKLASMTSVVSAMQLTNRAFRHKTPNENQASAITSESQGNGSKLETDMTKPQKDDSGQTEKATPPSTGKSFAKLRGLVRFAKWTSKKSSPSAGEIRFYCLYATVLCKK